MPSPLTLLETVALSGQLCVLMQELVGEDRSPDSLA
jgi:hypothetical protein